MGPPVHHRADPRPDRRAGPFRWRRRSTLASTILRGVAASLAARPSGVSRGNPRPGHVFGRFPRAGPPYRTRWFPEVCEVRTCCDPAGAADSSHGVRQNGVGILRAHQFSPRWDPNSNAPDVRLAPGDLSGDCVVTELTNDANKFTSLDGTMRWPAPASMKVAQPLNVKWSVLHCPSGASIGVVAWTYPDAYVDIRQSDE